MASLYKRKGSQFWWVKFSGRGGKIQRESTGMRIGDGHETRRAQEIRALKTLEETRYSPDSPVEVWDKWVQTFLTTRAKAQRSLERYLFIWRTMSMFLQERKVTVPRLLTFNHCYDYIEWRKKPCPKEGRYHASINTIRIELSILGMIMNEAVRRGYALTNPCRDINIAGTKPKPKPEFTEEHLAMIEAEIAKVSDQQKRTFLERSYFIARYQGCRQAETHLNPMDDVVIDESCQRGTITFRIKGDRVHTAPLHPKLIPLFQKLQDEGATETYKMPGNPRFAWYKFLRDSGLKAKIPGACFHCLRVTAVTRLARSKKVKEAEAMRFIGHASVLVHRVYQRLRADDLGDCLEALG